MARHGKHVIMTRIWAYLISKTKSVTVGFVCSDGVLNVTLNVQIFDTRAIRYGCQIACMLCQVCPAEFKVIFLLKGNSVFQVYHSIQLRHPHRLQVQRLHQQQVNSFLTLVCFTIVNVLKQFQTEFLATKTKANIVTNHKGRRQRMEPRRI